MRYIQIPFSGEDWTILLPDLRKLGRYGMEKIEKQQQYGQFFNNIDLKTAVFEINGQGLKRAYKSRSGAAAKNRTSRIFVGSSKRKYYMLCDLTKDQLQRLKQYNKDLAYYNAAKEKGLKDLKKPSHEVRFVLSIKKIQNFIKNIDRQYLIKYNIVLSRLFY